MDYKDDIRIDENALDIELLEQAELAIKYGRHWADCRRKVAKLEEKVKTTRSGLVAKANANPNKHLGTDVKPTGPNVESFYRTHKDHIKVKEELIDAQYDLDLAEIAKNEFSFTRKSALENLVKLNGQDYFAGPKVPRDLHSERKLKDKERNKAEGEVTVKKKKKKSKNKKK